MLVVPPAILDILQLQTGAAVGITIVEGKLVIAPQTKPHYSLEELLEQCDPDAPMSDEDRAWLDLKPVGNEL